MLGGPKMVAFIKQVSLYVTIMIMTLYVATYIAQTICLQLTSGKDCHPGVLLLFRILSMTSTNCYNNYNVQSKIDNNYAY